MLTECPKEDINAIDDAIAIPIATLRGSIPIFSEALMAMGATTVTAAAPLIACVNYLSLE
jgi:hypothetical protein